ncbi:hypothetical protein O181_058660 [Austropuccinia psidii MF-1]|uniref:mRNA-decapping enzyme C-terminal domain-containing protein n=1 Tax=Austropuccinia psidii MF-1 TaxID=1389203 RepID=A0A9Q3EGY6_9BASI|nr:hypothetical protein [Austropuccinia psidii MF-1]
MDPHIINFNVLRRHDPQICSIIDSTSYVVIYRYFHGAWSKTGFEGTMFLFQRQSSPLFGLFVLNRQGLDNFCQGLLPSWDVDLDEGLIIWRSAGATGDGDDDLIYGIWVYEENDRSRIADNMQNLIENATAHQNPSNLQPLSPPSVSLSHPVPRVPIITAGQSISLDQLFGVGSVSSEPPPQASTLPHPTNSVIESDEIIQASLPSNVMSPDPSNLPKGMQLLDSLFHKATIKSSSQQTNQHPSSDLALVPIQQNSSSNPKPSSQIPTSLPSQQTHDSPQRDQRDHKQNSSDENYKPQSYDSLTNTAHRIINPHQQNYRSNNQIHSHNSRRSSAGSSKSHGDRVAGNPINHQQSFGNANYSSPTIVPAPVPIENANEEARHNILSLLGHPAAVGPNSVYPTLINGQNSAANSTMSSANPHGNHREPISPESLVDIASDNYHHHSYARPVGNSGDGKIYSNPGSQQTSPHHPTHGLTPPNPTQQKLPPHDQVTTQPSSNSANNSPNGPRHQNRPYHQTNPNGPLSAPSQTIKPGQAAPGFNNSVWPFDKCPTRALSPLNPAFVQQRQSPSNITHRTNYHQQYHQTGNRHSNTPPQVNDFSRPNRSRSYSGSKNFSGNVNSKIAVETVDEALINQKINRSSLNNHQDDIDDDKESPLGKKAFVDGILDLLNNNGAFVDTLYARYLARYSEQYL